MICRSPPQALHRMSCEDGDPSQVRTSLSPCPDLSCNTANHRPSWTVRMGLACPDRPRCLVAAPRSSTSSDQPPQCAVAHASEYSRPPQPQARVPERAPSFAGDTVGAAATPGVHSPELLCSSDARLRGHARRPKPGQRDVRPQAAATGVARMPYVNHEAQADVSAL